MNVILASNSPRRRDILAREGVEFTVRTADVDEAIDDGLAAEPARAARELAKRKAGAVVQQLLAEVDGARAQLAAAEVRDAAGVAAAEAQARLGALAGEVAVVGADTMVVCDGRIFGKPHSASEGKGMLRKLSGRTHEVVTGVAVYMLQVEPDGRVSMGQGAFSETSEVTFRPLSDDDITAYLACGESWDKAGAYAIQGEGARLVEKVEGDFDNVVGLPVGTLLQTFPALVDSGGA